jgi:hypothetical protein
MRAGSSIRSAHFAIGREERGKSISWKPSRPRIGARDIADEQDHRLRILERDMDPMLALVAPGPRVTKATPGRPVIEPSAQAMNAAPPSCLHVTVSMAWS